MADKPVIDSQLAGTPLKIFEIETSWRRIMNYAAAIGDYNPAYFDDEKADGIIAHPVFPVAVTWNILGSIQNFIDSENFPTKLLFTQVHFTEHLELHKPVTPGQKLVIKGKVAAILPHRAGTHVVLRLDAHEKDGGAVFTEHIGAMLRGVECAGGGRGEDILPPVTKAPDNSVTVWEAKVPVSRLLPFIYDGCTDIIFPIHTSKKFAHMVGLPDIILQGTATLAMAVSELINRELGGNSGSVRSLSCRFTGMVIPGSEITVRFIGRNSAGNGSLLFFDVMNSKGERVLGNGCLTAG
jgi:acyl dehydratase